MEIRGKSVPGQERSKYQVTRKSWPLCVQRKSSRPRVAIAAWVKGKWHQIRGWRSCQASGFVGYLQDIVFSLTSKAERFYSFDQQVTSSYVHLCFKSHSCMNIEGRGEARNHRRGYFNSLWEEMMVPWVRVLSVEMEGNNFRIHFRERKWYCTLLYMVKDRSKGTKDAPYVIGLSNQLNGSTFY